jgi:hypothetical protein
MSSFSLPNIAKMYIIVMLNGFGLLLTSFGYKIVYVGDLKRYMNVTKHPDSSYMHITNRCVSWKFANGAELSIFVFYLN